MTSEILQRYSLIVEFLCHMLGPDYEIALYDLCCTQPSVVAIGNGHITGRAVGASLTNAAMQLIAQKTYDTQSWKLNYREVSANGRLLRSSALFIKDDEGQLVGLLCISFDDSRYRDLSERIFSLCHPDQFAIHNISISTVPSTAHSAQDGEQEAVSDSLLSTIDAVMVSVLHSNDLPSDRLNQEERLKIIRLLEQKEVFSRKGSISAVAKKLSCSQASVYRYISMVQREKNTDSYK